MDQNNPKHNVTHIPLSALHRLHIGGAGKLTVIHGDERMLRKADGSDFSADEQRGIRQSDGTLFLNNLPHAGGVISQGSGGRIGNITNSVIGSIVQNGILVQIPTVAAYDLVLTCPSLPDEVEMEDVTTLDIHAAHFPHQAVNKHLRCEMSGSCTMTLTDARLEDLTLDISGSCDVRIALAADADKTRNIQLDVSGSADVDLASCPTDKAELRVSGSADIRLDAEHVSGKVSGSADIRLRKQSLRSNTLRTSGCADVGYF